MAPTTCKRRRVARTRRIFTTPHGPAYETTRPRLRGEAARFAAMLAGNRRVARTELVRSAHDPDTAAAWGVRWWPADLAAWVRAITRDSRRRARAEGAGYVFAPAGYGRHWVTNPATGGRYHVSAESCTCPQWQMRCRHVGAPCKHIVEADKRGLFNAPPAREPAVEPAVEPAPTPRPRPCTWCAGYGRNRDYSGNVPCHHCFGTGWVRIKEQRQ